jgi:transposase
MCDLRVVERGRARSRIGCRRPLVRGALAHERPAARPWLAGELQLAEDHLADIKALDTRLKTVAAQISALVTATGTTLTSLFGIGPVIAGRILAETGDVSRFATKDKFASYNGTAPIDASSGDQVRHRLSRAGNRRINHALHMMAVTQIRYPWTDGRRYYERKRAEGKTPKEALRCLKRRLSDQACRQLVRDAQGRIEGCGSPTTRPPTPPTSTSPASGSPAAAPASRPPRPKASRPSSSWTGKTTASSASRSSTPAPRLHPDLLEEAEILS